MNKPIPIRPAATLILARDTAQGIEVFMMRRSPNSVFMSGVYVFPGGAVDPLDGGAEAEALCAGRTDAGASALLGFESGGLAYWVGPVPGLDHVPAGTPFGVSLATVNGPIAPGAPVIGGSFGG